MLRLIALCLLAVAGLRGVLQAQTTDDRAEADAALNDTFTLQGVTGVQPRRPDGGYDWDWRGPRNDPEWAWFFNRHEYFIPAYRMWQATGDERYLNWITATLDDWIITHPAPGRMSFTAAWRPLEAARRILGPWTLIYRKIERTPAFTPELRDRFLESVHAHGEQLRNHHALSGNHLITEMLALAQLCLVFPPEENTEEWLAYSLGRLAREYDAQVYPDGSYKELSTHYQRVVAVNYQSLLNLLLRHDRQTEAADWRPRVHRLWAYLHAVQKPDGTNPLNNDSDTEEITRLLADAAPLLAAAPPVETVALPYAGQMVFRSGDRGRPQWAFFDRGPHGTAHQHADRLHFSLSLGDRDFLVDNGRYTYVPGPWRDYFAGPRGHNVLLIDGHGGETGPAAVDASVPPATTFAQGEHWESASGQSRFALGGNPRAADWTRTVVNLRGDGWIVVDRVITFGARRIETLWHWHPDCEPFADSGRSLGMSHGEQRLNVAYASTANRGELAHIRGAENPVQGWHSQRFNERSPATCTLLTQRIDGPADNVWLFTPGSARPHVRILASQRDQLDLELIRGDVATRLSLVWLPDGTVRVESR